MSVTVASFRADFAQQFGNVSNYPDSAIQYWLSCAAILLGIATGAPPTVCSFEGSVTGDVLTVSSIDFGSISLLPLLLTGDNLAANIAIIGQLSGPAGGPGTYKLSAAANVAIENMVAVQSGVNIGGNPFWGPSSLTANSTPTTRADLATEMWVAHQLVLEKQAVDAAKRGGDPGTRIGVTTSKSVDGVSISFDVSAITENGAGYYNQTIYGMRFWRLAKAATGGPIQVGIGRAPYPFMSFNNCGLSGGYDAWPGPYPYPAPGDTGFG